MNLLRGNIKKKGFTLIEILCAVSLFSMFAIVQIKLLFCYINNFNSFSEDDIFYTKAEDSLNFIGDRIEEGKCDKIDKNQIIIYTNAIKEEEGKEKELITKDYLIKLENHDIKMIYNINGYYANTEVIMGGIEMFSIVEKGNLAYVTITSKERKMERCYIIIPQK